MDGWNFTIFVPSPSLSSFSLPGHGGFRRHGPRPGLAFGLGVGMAMRAERRAIRRSYRYGGGGYYGRPVTVVQAPPPPPHVLASAQIPFLREAGNGVTLFHVTVLSVTSLQWEVAARYSSFAALQQRLAYFSRAIRAPFPGKKPLRSFFGGLDEQAKEERRWMLSNWLAEVVALSAANPGVRRELNAFLRTPPELCVVGAFTRLFLRGFGKGGCFIAWEIKKSEL
jgi:hypothetical protein